MDHFVGPGHVRVRGTAENTSHPAKKNRSSYFCVTALDADPPNVLRTVIFAGYTGQGSEALNRPLPLFFNVPTRAPVAVT